jgi:protein-S-isoprenylcysteine O-methyltransferase Ste14
LGPNKVSDAPGVLVFSPALFAGTLVLGLVLHWLRPVSLLPPLAARLAGLVLLAFSWWLVHSAEAAMKRAGTNLQPGQPSLAIVTDGPFRFSRNPMYLATHGPVPGDHPAGQHPLAIGSAAADAAGTPRGVVRREERYLEAKFGEPYRAYKSRVRRWI